MKSRIYLRALEPDDYKISVQWRNDPEIEKMVCGPKYFVSQEREKEWTRTASFNNDRIVLAICLVENNKYIGNVMLQDMDYINRSCHIPVLIGDKDEWGKGYAMEARMMIMKFAFEERGMERVWGEVLDTNSASLKMAQKCGMKVEGVKRKAVFKDGAFHDVTLVAALKSDFFEAYNVYCEKHK